MTNTDLPKPSSKGFITKACHAKIGPPRSGSLTYYGKKLAKTGPPGPIFAAKIDPGDQLA